MIEISAHAVKVGKTIEVTVSGYLPDSCHEARIADVYPGGNIVYVKDPGFAQVFVSEISKPNLHFCTLALVPFVATVYINDDIHSEVEILLNHNVALKIPVTKKGEKFIVLKLTGGIVPNGSCSIVPENALYPAIYTKEFGPGSFDACAGWIAQHCRFSGVGSPIFSVKGGGGEAPRGLL